MAFILFIMGGALMVAIGQVMNRRPRAPQTENEFITEKKALFAEAEKTWLDRFTDLPKEKKKCRISLLGLTENRCCDNAFNCANCEFARGFLPSDLIIRKPFGEDQALAGVRIPGSIFLHRAHTWVKIEEDGQVLVGIDDFARRVIGPVTWLNASSPGTILEQGETACILKMGSADVPILSPVDGKVTGINHEVQENPELINRDPYGRGWLFKIKAYNLYNNLRDLFSGAEAKLWLQEEFQRLQSILAPEAAVVLQDGGEMVQDLSAALGKRFEQVARDVMLTM